MVGYRKYGSLMSRLMNSSYFLAPLVSINLFTLNFSSASEQSCVRLLTGGLVTVGHPDYMPGRGPKVLMFIVSMNQRVLGAFEIDGKV